LITHAIHNDPTITTAGTSQENRLQVECETGVFATQRACQPPAKCIRQRCQQQGTEQLHVHVNECRLQTTNWSHENRTQKEAERRKLSVNTANSRTTTNDNDQQRKKATINEQSATSNEQTTDHQPTNRRVRWLDNASAAKCVQRPPTAQQCYIV